MSASTNRATPHRRPFLDTYEGVRVECARPGEDYSVGQIVPVWGSAPADPAVPADAVTASGSGLDPHISIAIRRPAGEPGRQRPRRVSPDLIRQAVADNTAGRTLGFLGEPRVNVLALNIELDEKYPGWMMNT